MIGPMELIAFVLGAALFGLVAWDRFRIGRKPDGGGLSAEFGVDRASFDEAWGRLQAAGYDLVPPDESWQAFEAARTVYAGRLEAMASYWATPTNSWLESAAIPRFPAHTAAVAAEQESDLHIQRGSSQE